MAKPNKDKPLSHQQKRWNRHFNYLLDANPTARAIFDAAGGRLSAKEALVCAERARWAEAAVFMRLVENNSLAELK